MPRLARLVPPRHPHHVVQRGVRSIDIFRRGGPGDGDRKAYLGVLHAHSKYLEIAIETGESVPDTT